MSDFAQSLDKFKYDGDNDKCESKLDTKQVSFSQSSTRISRLDISELSPEQRHAYTQFTKGENLFITGPGGYWKNTISKTFNCLCKIN